ncbi:unnamed protein product [Cyprideis torosa]|uniref:Uncharacterized protein n=1 Tax=Cyprideis torosa TaxID=163714 RepID=A0A7R8W8Z7_9CRUS|nr:unnamed protein product [Cyprideis torosa]CAG0886788.1 unnamed protein product [Cyprideis torosa]
MDSWASTAKVDPHRQHSVIDFESVTVALVSQNSLDMYKFLVFCGLVGVGLTFPMGGGTEGYGRSRYSEEQVNKCFLKLMDGGRSGTLKRVPTESFFRMARSKRSRTELKATQDFSQMSNSKGNLATMTKPAEDPTVASPRSYYNGNLNERIPDLLLICSRDTNSSSA